MGVPLLFGDRLIGMLTLDKLEADFYTAEHVRMAKAFAAYAATAIENARLFETERSAREQAETLRAAAQSLGSTLSLHQVFDLILSELRGRRLRQLQRPGDRSRRHGHCWRTWLSQPRRVARTTLQLARTRRSRRRGGTRREPVIIGDVSARFEHFKEETHGGGRVKGWLGVPLLFGTA